MRRPGKESSRNETEKPCSTWAAVACRWIERPPALTLPASVLLFRAEGLRVGVVRNGHVALTPVQIGHDYGAKVEIIAGLAAQDHVILNPSDSLSQGERVEVEKGGGE